MLSIIDDAALAFESFFIFGFGNGHLLIALAPQYSPHTSTRLDSTYVSVYAYFLCFVFDRSELKRISSCLIASATVYIHALYSMIDD